MKQARRTALWEQKLGVSADFYRSSTATSVKIMGLDMVAASSRGDIYRWHSSAAEHRGYPTLKKDSLVHCAVEMMFSIVVQLPRCMRVERDGELKTWWGSK